MRKLTEDLSGNGEVFESETSFGKAYYQLNVFQNVVGNEKGYKSVEGEISFDNNIKILQLLSKKI
jgi:hypothetical protein